MSEIVALLVGAALVNNALLAGMFGLDRGRDGDPVDDAFVFGTVCALATALVVSIQWPLAAVLPLRASHLFGAALVLAAAAAVAFVAWLVARAFAPLADMLRGRWLVVAANAAVIGGALLALRPDRTYAQSLLVAFGSGAGYVAVLAMLAAMRRRLASDAVPAAFRGAPIELLTAGLMALGFLGFAGVAPP